MYCLLLMLLFFSRVDYCNGIFTFCNKYTIQRLQRVQNCFARLVFRLPRSSSCSNVIRELGWLRINKRVDFKICCLVHKCVYGFCPSYLKLLVSPTSTSYASTNLRSHNGPLLFCPISKNAFVRRSFSFVATRLWNSLPIYVRNERRFYVFKRLLRRHFSL